MYTKENISKVRTTYLKLSSRNDIGIRISEMVDIWATINKLEDISKLNIYIVICYKGEHVK